MPARTITFDTVREIGLALPGVEEGKTYGSPALFVGGKMFTCLPSHRSAEPRSLAVRVPFDRRDMLIGDESETFYVKPHYVSYATVLVRLQHVTRKVLAELLEESRDFVAAGKDLGPRKRGREALPARPNRRRGARRRR